jgi:hypothetical protein
LTRVTSNATIAIASARTVDLLGSGTAVLATNRTLIKAIGAFNG